MKVLRVDKDGVQQIRHVRKKGNQEIPLCFGTKERDNSLICRRCAYRIECKEERDRQQRGKRI